MADTEINIATFEQISTRLSQLLVNYSNMASNFNDLFYNPDPKDITLQLYNTSGTLVSYTIPNRAKDFRYVRNGEGSPEASISAPIGTIYMDTTNGNLYIKQIGEGSTGWAQIRSDKSVEIGSGSPEGFIVREKGILYVDTLSNDLYLKTTDTGSTGWILISSNMSSLASKDLDNLTTEGEAHFANPSLSNLNNVGKAFINSKVSKTGDETISGIKTFTDNPVFSGSDYGKSLTVHRNANSNSAITYSNTSGVQGRVGFDSANNIPYVNIGNTDAKQNLLRNNSFGTSVGSTSIPVYINASGIATAITRYDGNSATATKATQDADGNVITNTYATKSELNAAKTTLETEVNNKLDKNVGNIDNTAKATIVGWGMPDMTKVVSISSSGYTAPANGYIIAEMKSSGNDPNHILYVDGILIYHFTRGGDYGNSKYKSCYFPISKDSIFTWSFTQGSMESCKFIYCKSEDVANA